MFQHILVPVDGSDYSLKAAKTAASIAEKYASKVTLLCVRTLPKTTPGFNSGDYYIPNDFIKNLEDEGKEILQQAQQVFTEKSVETLIRIGNPAQEILEEAKNGYELIVMGSRGLGEIRGFLMGSVSDRVSHHAKVNVMIVH
ncbi:MAG TPA: universal stress protein [Desulfobacteria bacterium]|nr:universal stress protein [Desulfobacteria bacterium]